MAQAFFQHCPLGDEDVRRINRRFGNGEQVEREPFRCDLMRDTVGHALAPDAHAILERQLLRERSAGVPGRHACFDRRYRAATRAIGMPTRQMCANNCVAMEIGFGGSGVPKRSGTAIRFMTTYVRRP